MTRRTRQPGRDPLRPVHFAAAAGLAVLAIIATHQQWAIILWLALHRHEGHYLLLVPPASLLLAWVRRARLWRCPGRGRWVGPVMVGVGAALGGVGAATALDTLWLAAAVIIVLGAIVAATGTDLLRRLAPAVLVWVFIIPVPATVRGEISPTLHGVTAAGAERALAWLGVQADFVGTHVNVAGVEVAMTAARNTFRMSMGLLLMAYVVAFALPLRTTARVLLLVFSPLCAVACNVARLVLITLLSPHLPGNADSLMERSALWLMVLLNVLAVLGLIRLLAWAWVPTYHFHLAKRP